MTQEAISATSNRAGAASAGAISTVEALDLAFGGAACELVRSDGTSKVLNVRRWAQDATPADLDLFVNACAGPTLDIGCGPGRITAALVDHGVTALGIDISPEAVRQTRERGAHAVCHDIFQDLPWSYAWQHIVLADGNIGLGGDPLRLLKRVAGLLAPDGVALVELATSSRSARERMRLRVGQRVSPAFGWATVGVNGIHTLAGQADLLVGQLHWSAGRIVARLYPEPSEQPESAVLRRPALGERAYGS